MCTVVVRVPPPPADADAGVEPVRLLAVRDEDPQRPWNPLGEWWPDRPGLIGVQDRLAGGAWLAAEGPRLAVLLNRAGHPAGVGPEELESRGGIVLASVGGQSPAGTPRTLGFNLVEVDGTAATVTSWDGERITRRELPPGTHMLAHDDVDDEATPRIRQWHRAFERAGTPAGDGWWDDWVAVLADSARLDPADDRAIIRDNHPHGYPTVSLLACVAEVSPAGADVRYAQLDRPGAWNPLVF
ncbi:NRDE family protein [Microbacterium marinilacus]|uniref:NRDE family protein n=1 Tax=Microbacterium marinilacus TaxID=415209 RepID=A0ABP7BEX6_9MICO|nr:NRDE family protein [Microbacterium marinilacus]MBY0689621.1 NRDE family protein [Microbacterium marinilacus]